MIISMLYKSTPDDLRFIMIDPKMLELSVYEGSPSADRGGDRHEGRRQRPALVRGRDGRRYKLMSAVGVRNLKGYNDKVLAAIEEGEPLLDPLWRPGDSMDQMPPELEKLPHIVVVVDEFADMMMIVGKKVEELIARIAQKARAAGIHLILATQRPSVDVIPVLSGQHPDPYLVPGIEQDRLPYHHRSGRCRIPARHGRHALHAGRYLNPTGCTAPLSMTTRCTRWWRTGNCAASRTTSRRSSPVNPAARAAAANMAVVTTKSSTPVRRAVAFVVESRRGSTSSVQRKFKIGYNRAARLIEQMENQGIVSAPGGNGQRDVLAPPPVRD